MREEGERCHKEGGKKKLGVKVMVMFVILIMMIVLRMYTCVKAYQVLHYKYMPFVNYTSITHIRVCICVCVRRATEEQNARN